MSDESSPHEIEFFLDVMCPWAYQTSIWIREVRERRSLDITWSFFSLEEINREEGKKHAWEREWTYGWSQMRVGAWLRRQGMDVIDRWYEGVGRAFHEQAVTTQDRDVHRDLLADLGLPPEAVDEAIADPTTADEVRADHDRAVTEFGAFGVPVLVFPDGQGLFGPTVVPAPRGDEAVRLWDWVLGYRDFPGLYELKRPKTGQDMQTIADTFEPYLRARTWHTVENPAP